MYECTDSSHVIYMNNMPALDGYKFEVCMNRICADAQKELSVRVYCTYAVTTRIETKHSKCGGECGIKNK